MNANSKRFHRVRVFTAMLLAAVGLSIGVAASPALASTVTSANYCQTSSGDYCLNDWSGGGTVKMEEGGVSNEDFVAEDLPGRCGGYVTSSCPFSNTAFDSRYEGFPIIQIRYEPDSKCIGTPSGATDVTLGTCNTASSGTGGGSGTVFVDHDGYLISLEWSNASTSGNAACVSGDAANDGSINLDLSTASGCPTWDIGMRAVAGYAQAIYDGLDEWDAFGVWTGGNPAYVYSGGHDSTGPGPTDVGGDTGLDCSGFSRWVYDLAFGSDVLGSGATYDQSPKMGPVSDSDAAPGDLFFFGPALSDSTHVGVYIGDDEMIDEPETGDHAQIDSFSPTADTGYGNPLGFFQYVP